MPEVHGGPDGREWGALTMEVQKMAHELKNLKHSVNLLSDEVDSLEKSLDNLQSKIYTTIAVCSGLATAAAFVMQNFTK